MLYSKIVHVHVLYLHVHAGIAYNYITGVDIISNYRLDPVSHSQIFTPILGELDPDRVGSGIQYGNAQLRRVGPPPPAAKKSCSC